MMYNNAILLCRKKGHYSSLPRLNFLGLTKFLRNWKQSQHVVGNFVWGHVLYFFLYCVKNSNLITLQADGQFTTMPHWARDKLFLNIKTFLMILQVWEKFPSFVLMFFVLLCVPWFISVMIFSIFDTECIIFEQASVINCSQDFFTSHPEHWIFAWLYISMVSSFVFLLIIYLNHKALNYQLQKAKQIHKKGSFYSLIFLLLTTSMFYFIRIATNLERISEAISVLLFTWCFVTVAVICCFNYLPRVQWTETTGQPFTTCWWKKSLTRNSNFIIYWLALSMYFVETTLKLLAVMLDPAYDVAPIIESTFGKKYETFRGAMVIMIGFKIGLHTRMAFFFWEKIFYGGKDLFSEPGNSLIEEPMEYKTTGRNEPQEAIELDEIDWI